MTAWGGQPFGAGTGAAIASFGSVPSAYWVAAVVMIVSAAGAAMSLKKTSGTVVPTVP